MGNVRRAAHTPRYEDKTIPEHVCEYHGGGVVVADHRFEKRQGRGKQRPGR